MPGGPNDRQDGTLRHICKDPLLEENLSCFSASHSASKIVLKYVCTENNTRVMDGEQAWTCAASTPLNVPFVIKSANVDSASIAELLRQEDSSGGEEEAGAFNVDEWIADLAYTTDLNYGPSVCGDDLPKCKEIYR
jgi:hypothetical protein